MTQADEVLDACRRQFEHARHELQVGCRAVAEDRFYDPAVLYAILPLATNYEAAVARLELAKKEVTSD